MNKKQALAGQIRLLKDLNMKPNYSDLARSYGLDRRTIKKYYEAGGVPKRKKKKEFSKWDPYSEIIQDKINMPGATIRGVYEYFTEKLESDKLPGTYESLKAFVRKKGFAAHSSSKKAHIFYETDPGKQLQVDWIEDMSLTLKSGEVVKFNIYSATLGYSREHVFLYTKSKTTEDFIRCTIDAFRKLGGVTDKLLTDNMSAVVSVKGPKKRVHPKIKQFFKDLGVQLELCKVRSPQTKGKCESANRFRSWIVPYNNELDSEEAVRNLIDEVLTRKTNDKVNETTKIPPTELFKKEKEYLKPLPSNVLLDSYIQEYKTVTVPQTLLVPFKGSGYSVPKKYIGCRVHIYQHDNQVLIYDQKNELITIHSITDQTRNYHNDHYIEALADHSPHRTREELEMQAIENLKKLSQGFDK